MARGQALVREHLLAGLSEAERAACDAVVDYNAAEITCPACGHTFPTGPSECPDCGLFLG